MTFSLHQYLSFQTAIAEQQQLKTCLDELSHVLAMRQELDLYQLVESWCTNFEFKKGTLWQLLDTNVSNLKDVFDYKFLTRQCSLPKAVEKNQYHAKCLFNNLEHGNWMDQWSAITSDHLNNAHNTWNYEYFHQPETEESEESEDEDEDENEGFDECGNSDNNSNVIWPPLSINCENWFTTTVIAFNQLEQAFDNLNYIYILQELYDHGNKHITNFRKVNILDPLKLLKKMREFLISMSAAGTFNKQHAKLAWAIFAEQLLNSCIKTQNLVMYASS